MERGRGTGPGKHLGFTGHSCWRHLDLQSCAKTKGDATIALGEQAGHGQKFLFSAHGCSLSAEESLVYSPTCCCCWGDILSWWFYRRTERGYFYLT